MGIPNLVGNDTLIITVRCLIPKCSAFEHQKWWTNGHHVFDLSRFSEVKSDFPPHLKIKPMTCPIYGRNFMLSTESAQFLCLSTPLKDQLYRI